MIRIQNKKSNVSTDAPEWFKVITKQKVKLLEDKMKKEEKKKKKAKKKKRRSKNSANLPASSASHTG